MLLLFLLLSTSPCFKSQSLTSSLSLLFSRLAIQVFCFFSFSFFGVLHIVVFSVLTSFFFFNFLFFMNKKWIGGDLNWRLPPRRVYSDTLPTGPRSARAGDQDDFLFFLALHVFILCSQLGLILLLIIFVVGIIFLNLFILILDL